MVTGEVTVVNESGLHLRPAGVLTQTCISFKSNIYLYHGDRKIVAKSVLSVMAAGVRQGTKLRVEADGPDEEAALKAVIDAISSGLGEGTAYSSKDRLF